MKPWQFDALFVVGIGGAVALLVAALVGVDVPIGSPGVGAILLILGFFLPQKGALTRGQDKKSKPRPSDDEEDEP